MVGGKQRGTEQPTESTKQLCRRGGRTSTDTSPAVLTKLADPSHDLVGRVGLGKHGMGANNNS